MYFRTLEVATKDGNTVALRSIRPDEAKNDSERKYFEDMLDKNTNVQLGAYVNNEMVGRGSIVIDDSAKQHCKLEISIDEKAGNNGIGSRMMEALIDVAQRVGYEEIQTSLCKDSEAAMHILDKYGFVERDSMMVKCMSVKFEPEDKATLDLEEWIEEQGIQLRY